MTPSQPCMNVLRSHRVCVAATLLRFLRCAKLCLRALEMLSILVASVARIEDSLRLCELLLGLCDGDLVGHPGVLTQDRDSTLRYGDEAAVHGDDLPRAPSSQKITTALGTSTPSTGS